MLPVTSGASAEGGVGRVTSLPVLLDPTDGGT